MSTFILKSNGDLYGCGQNTSGQLGLGDLDSRTTFTYISSDISDVKNNSSNYSVIKNTLGEIYIAGGANGYYNCTFEKLSNFESDINARILGNNMIVSSGKAFSISYINKNVSVIFNKYQIIDYVYSPLNYVMYTEDGIYTNLENITAPGYKSNCFLRQVMENVIYINGKSNLINVVDRNGEVYENNFIKNTNLKNVKKIIVSGAQGTVYVLTNDGNLYAKGDGLTGMWGDTMTRTEFQHITSNGTDYINNIKDIFSTTDVSSMCYITNDGELYWAGHLWHVCLPNVSGDLVSGATPNLITAYPKKVTSPVVNRIGKDIIYVARSYEGVNNVKITFLLTNNGKLYVMSNNSNTSGLEKVVTSDFEELVIKENVKVKQIETSKGLNIAVLENGEVYGWGYNTYGILGNGYELNEIYSTPQRLMIDNVDSVSLGDGFAIFKTKTGEIYGIGKNDYGQLGTGDTKYRIEFVRCPMLEE